MTDSVRLIFVALCALGLFVIVAGAIFEWGRARRGISILTPRHFRWRMISVAFWVVILSCFAGATLFLWPASRADEVTARRFILVVSGATLLLIIALGITALDVLWTARTRIARQGEFKRNLDELARREIERAKNPDGDDT